MIKFRLCRQSSFPREELSLLLLWKSVRSITYFWIRTSLSFFFWIVYFHDQISFVQSSFPREELCLRPLRKGFLREHRAESPSRHPRSAEPKWKYFLSGKKTEYRKYTIYINVQLSQQGVPLRIWNIVYFCYHLKNLM